MSAPEIHDGYLYDAQSETGSQGFAGRATAKVAGPPLGDGRMAAWEGASGGRGKEGEARVMSAEALWRGLLTVNEACSGRARPIHCLQASQA